MLPTFREKSVVHKSEPEESQFIEKQFFNSIAASWVKSEVTFHK